MINYLQTLSLVEEFMAQSGIRSFCASVCGGQCCTSCRERCQPEAGERRLACSAFICPTIRLLFPMADRERYSQMYRAIMESLNQLNGAVTGGYRHCHYRAVPPAVVAQFRVNYAIVAAAINADTASQVRARLAVFWRRVAATGKRFNFFHGLVTIEGLQAWLEKNKKLSCRSRFQLMLKSLQKHNI